ncbi:MAG: hypothetical protein ACPGDB_04260 [Fusobacterium sp.]
MKKKVIRITLLVEALPEARELEIHHREPEECYFRNKFGSYIAFKELYQNPKAFEEAKAHAEKMSNSNLQKAKELLLQVKKFTEISYFQANVLNMLEDYEDTIENTAKPIIEDTSKTHIQAKTM